MNQTTITEQASVATLINVFTVEPEHQRELLTLLATVTNEVMRHLPGFVAAFEAMLAHPAAREHMSQVAALAVRFEPHLYTVDSVHHR